jgi:hypothetical protein
MINEKGEKGVADLALTLHCMQFDKRCTSVELPHGKEARFLLLLSLLGVIWTTHTKVQ